MVLGWALSRLSRFPYYLKLVIVITRLLFSRKVGRNSFHHSLYGISLTNGAGISHSVFLLMYASNDALDNSM